MRIQCIRCGTVFRIDPSRVTTESVRIKCTRCATVFPVTLPPRQETATPPFDPLGSSPTLLVVDDAPFFLEVIVDILKPLAATLLTSSDGVAALEIVRRERPAVVVLDLNLPGMDGFQLMREIRADPRLAGVRLLAMSGVFRKEADAAEALRAGADAFFNKSFRPEQLLDKVRDLLKAG